MAAGKRTQYGHAWRQLRTQAKTTYPWVCHLCGQPIQRGVRGPWSWSLDHLDPIQWHGTRTPTLDRVRPAHLRCNIARGNRTRHPQRRLRRASRDWTS